MKPNLEKDLDFKSGFNLTSYFDILWFNLEELLFQFSVACSWNLTELLP